MTFEYVDYYSVCFAFPSLVYSSFFFSFFWRKEKFFLLQSLVCRALYPRVLRIVFSRTARFGQYSVCFEEHPAGQFCVVRTQNCFRCLKSAFGWNPWGSGYPLLNIPDCHALSAVWFLVDCQWPFLVALRLCCVC